ncbi:MAG TPA: glycine betaine ABC transporter substrate-binding protein [Steroidobacteraceae bacterium]|jgi:osmoprotectant transport system permease protein|nr:glycine betaine ABC transporter substrate-binding protein [Steroidobacteraceae bacterium]
MKAGAWLGVLLATFLATGALAADKIVVGSKIFTEGYVLAEIAAQTLEASRPPVPIVRKLGMGSTGILFESLHSGAIDVYSDYTGTLAEAILKAPQLRSVAQIHAALLKMGIVISEPLGFNNTYALAVREDFAKAHDLVKISDLGRLRASIRCGFSYEFMDRQDGYPGLAERYRLGVDPAHVSRMEHSLTYEAIDQQAVDVIDVYSTDAKIRKFHLRVLEDDLQYFPNYQAVWVARSAFVQRYPAQWRALRQWEGRISQDTMQELNAQVDIDKRNVAEVAAAFRGTTTHTTTAAAQIGRRTLEHLWLVGVSLAFSIFVGVPLGILAVRHRRTGQVILTLSAVTQTVPSLALLCFLIPVFGVGTKPALAALCLYSLLPVVLNTFTGIRGIDPRHLENARAFGLTPRQILFSIVLPLASPALLTGIRTATIVSIGTATLAALVGAGGYGVPIVSGLSLNDVPTILTGAIPAAIMAWLAHLAFNLLGRIVIPAGLQAD